MLQSAQELLPDNQLATSVKLCAVKCFGKDSPRISGRNEHQRSVGRWYEAARALSRHGYVLEMTPC